MASTERHLAWQTQHIAMTEPQGRYYYACNNNMVLSCCLNTDAMTSRANVRLVVKHNLADGALLVETGCDWAKLCLLDSAK